MYSDMMPLLNIICIVSFGDPVQSTAGKQHDKHLGAFHHAAGVVQYIVKYRAAILLFTII